ncbi:divalent-cation tolerance protein CutA [Candidatus Woesearchaeota archaeon]|nr:divalent-cation tolerance protein CutA [Candidatus Woesearchaeota archaeon]
MTQIIFIYITFPSREEAKKISKHLLEKRLIACVNIFPIESMYWWKNEIQEDNEFVIIAKTSEKNFEKVKQEVKEIHTYETPCIVSWKIDNVNSEFLDWIKKEIKK